MTYFSDSEISHEDTHVQKADGAVVHEKSWPWEIISIQTTSCELQKSSLDGLWFVWESSPFDSVTGRKF